MLTHNRCNLKNVEPQLFESHPFHSFVRTLNKTQSLPDKLKSEFLPKLEKNL